MRTTYHMNTRLAVFAALILSLFFAVRVLAAGTTDNLFGARDLPTQGIDIFMKSAQLAPPGHYVNLPMGLSYADAPNSGLLRFFEVGSVQNCTTGPGADCTRHPYMARQDGDAFTYAVYIDFSRVLGDVIYEYKVIHPYYRGFRGYFCYGSPVTCVQEGDDLLSIWTDSYPFTAAGFETPDGVRFSDTIFYYIATYQSTYGNWTGFCPNTTIGSGTVNAAVSPCNGNGAGWDWYITPTGMARMPQVGSNY